MSKKLTKLAREFGILTKKSLIGFGRYGKYTVKQVLKIDPGYLCWLHDNTKHKLISHVISEARKKAAKTTPSRSGGRSYYPQYSHDDDFDVDHVGWGGDFVDCGPFW